jgi:hypothetical protein
MTLRPIGGDDLPELTCDEVFVLTLLPICSVLLAESEWWSRVPRDVRTYFTRARFGELVASLRQKGYIAFVDYDAVVRKRGEMREPYYAITEAGEVVTGQGAVLAWFGQLRRE